MNDTSLIDAAPVSYSAYMSDFETAVAEGRTSGSNQTDAMLAYTKLNLSRMKRLNKTAVPGEELIKSVSDLPFEMTWLVLTEYWCGDAAQNIPFIAKTAEAAGNAELKLLFRDENLRYTERYLTNGARSIPKLVVYRDDTGEQIAVWGPRPDAVQQMVIDYKNSVDSKPSFDVFAAKIHAWYTSNKNKDLESELLAIFRQIHAAPAAV